MSRSTLAARAALAAALGLLVALSPGAARADGTEPAAAAAPAPAPAPLGRPPGTVRIHLRAYKGKGTARLFAAQSVGGNYVLMCQTPCDADVVPGTPLRVTLGDNMDEPHDFVMGGAPGSEMDLEVRPASKGALAGGIVMTSIGGLTAVIGLVLLAVAASSNLGDEDGLRTGGAICLAIGGGLTVGGIVLITSRSKEPRLREMDHPRQGRADVESGAASALRSGPSPLPAFTPLTFSMTF